jgi:hypothetical protein
MKSSQNKRRWNTKTLLVGASLVCLLLLPLRGVSLCADRGSEPGSLTRKLLFRRLWGVYIEQITA